MRYFTCLVRLSVLLAAALGVFHRPAKPVGPLHPIKDFLQCGKLDAKLKKDYEDIYGDQQRLTRDEAESFLNSMTEKYPEMNNLYPSPTDMLDQAESNSRNNWYYMLRPE